MSLESLLDQDLDDIADLPEFAVPPAGSYAATILKWENKEINKHPSWEITFKLNSTLELDNPNDTPIVDGTECSIAYMMDNDFGAGRYKEFATPICAHLRTSKPREYTVGAKGLEIVLTTAIRQNKEKTQNYLDIKGVAVL